MKTYWPIRSRKTSSRDCTSSGVKARKSATTSNVRLPIAAPTESGSPRSPISCSQPSGSGRVFDFPRLRTKTSMPTSRHRWVHAELMIPEPPRYNTDKAGMITPSWLRQGHRLGSHVRPCSSAIRRRWPGPRAQPGHRRASAGIHDAIGHEVHGRDDRPGRERDRVAGLGLSGGDRLEDCLADDFGWTAPALRLGVEGSHHVHLRSIDGVAGILLGAFQRTSPPLGADSAWLDNDHIDAEFVQFQPQAVAEPFHRELAGVVPGAEWLAQMPADG